LDGQSFPNFPKGSHGKKISFDYVGIVSERRIVDQFVDLLKEIGGNVLEITCNSLCLGVCAINNGSDAVVVDIKTTSTIINLYNKAGDIKSITTLNKGSRWYYDEVKKIFGVNEKTDILPTINALNTIKNVNPNTVLLYKHGNEFLTIQDADTQSFVIALKIITNKLFKDISSALSELQIKCHANFNKIYLNVIESLQLVFKDVCPHSILENLPIEMLTNTIVGLEDYAVNDMLLATTYVHNLQSANNSYIYSIDPFISDKAENYQLKQNL
jgi:hypothetical protein